MSESIYNAVVDVLGGLVGKPVAQICISSAAMKLGKTSEALTVTDLDAVLVEVRSSMSAFASADVLDHAIDDIRARVAS
jgi:hypothetical protein